MAQTPCNDELARIANGISQPLFFDGQVVAAADLTLARTKHDAELWRMRRLMHGWGIVAGLVVAAGDGGNLLVYPGYGICPSGDELYLPDVAVIGDISAKVAECCGPPAAGCALDAVVTGAKGPVEAWLVARPEVAEQDWRAGLPAGCANPANQLKPARLCGLVTLELRCAAPDGHILRPAECAEISAHICQGAPIFMPPDNPSPDLLILARLTLIGEALSVDTTVRRNLYPVSLLQDFLSSCVCGLKAAPEPPTDGPVIPTHPVEVQPQPGGKISWDALGQIVGKVTAPGRPRILDQVTINALKAAGVAPADLIKMPTADLIKIPGLEQSTAAITAAKASLGPFSGLINSPSF